jgi:four helix bundle protein
MSGQRIRRQHGQFLAPQLLSLSHCARHASRDRRIPRKSAELKAQMRRATDSITNNIVEGCAAASRKEFARYLDISIKSASEVDYQPQLAHDLGAIDTATWQPLAREVVELRKMLWAYGARSWQLQTRAIRGRPTQPGVTLKPDDSN